jgi:aerobic carbon-monoxide dehydrogenase medium subunit
MYAFNYEHPKTLADASKLVQAGGQALAGGQTLLASMKQRLMQPEQFVDLRSIPELVGVRKEGDQLVIGAMTKHCDVENNALGQTTPIPALAALAGGIGDRQVRAMGTLGGSVANNDPAACYPSALLALGATVHTDARKISAQDFFLGMYATALNPGELITAVSFPDP